MNKSLVRAGVALVVTVVLIIAAVAIYRATRGSSETVTVEPGSIEATIQTVGRLVPNNPIAVRSQTSGQVRLVAVSVGDTVQSGDVLVELERQPFEDAIQKAEQQLTHAEMTLNLAEQQAGPDPTPQQLADKLAAEQQVRNAKEALEAAQTALSQSLILAPNEGTVLQVQTTAGAPVQPGTEVIQMANLDDLALQIDLDEMDLPHVTPGMPVTFTLDAYPGMEINGTIRQISPTAETSGGTTTFRGTVDFNLPTDLVVRPGMNSDVSIKTAVRQNVLLIPESTLRTIGNRTFVTVRLPNGNEEEREIRVGLRSQGMVEVASGLEAGDQVVLP